MTISYTFDGVTQTKSYTANVSAKTLPKATVYDKVTSTSFADGDKILIVAVCPTCSTGSDEYAMGTYNSGNNVPAASVTLTESDTRITEANKGSALVYTLEDSGSTSGDNKLYYLHNGSSYLYAASSSGNQLKASSKETAGNNGKWLITVSNGTASITAPLSSNRNVMQFNHNGGTDIFSCYSSASQTSIMVFKEAEITIGTASLIQLTATGPADNTKHEEDVLTVSDFVATAHYDTGESATVTPTITDGPAKLVVGNNVFTLSYTESGVTKTCSVTVVAAEIEAELDGIVWSQEGVSRDVFDGSAIGSFGTLLKHYDDESTTSLDLSECTVAVYNNTSGSKAHDIANPASYNWNLSNDNGKYLGVSYEGYTKYSGIINVVETINDVQIKVKTISFTTKASSTNPFKVGDTVVFAYDEESMEMTSVDSGTKGVVEEFTSHPTGKYALEVCEGYTTGTFAFKNGSDYIAFTSDAESSNNKLWLQTTLDEKSSWTVSYDSTDVTITNCYNTGRSLRYNTNSNQERIAGYVSASTTFPLIQVYIGEETWSPSGGNIANTDATAQKVVLEFAEEFNRVMQCDSSGETTGVAGNWSDLSDTFDDWFFNGDKDLTEDQIENALALFAGGDAVDGGDTLQDMLARYQYVCAKYKLTDFLANKAHRPPVPKSINFRVFASIQDAGSAIGIIAISVASLAAVGGYFLFRKKKED